jgi:enoyl-CoA hydratase/carnithine racemase
VTTYEQVAITSRDGVTEIRLHFTDGPLQWNAVVHRELGEAFIEVGSDTQTKVVIVTGTGPEFCTAVDVRSFAREPGWNTIWWEGKRLLKSLLDLDVPVIGAVNGPAFVHAEIPLLADAVLASDTAVFADKAHFIHGAAPGDGAHLIWPYLLGPRRGKYFLLTGQEIGAQEGLRLGLINELVPADELCDRAWELALDWARRPLPLLRYTRECLNNVEREHLLMGTGVSHGLALEGLAMADAQAERSRRQPDD